MGYYYKAQKALACLLVCALTLTVPVPTAAIISNDDLAPKSSFSQDGPDAKERLWLAVRLFFARYVLERLWVSKQNPARARYAIQSIFADREDPVARNYPFTFQDETKAGWVVSYRFTIGRIGVVLDYDRQAKQATIAQISGLEKRHEVEIERRVSSFQQNLENLWDIVNQRKELVRSSVARALMVVITLRESENRAQGALQEARRDLSRMIPLHWIETTLWLMTFGLYGRNEEMPTLGAAGRTKVTKADLIYLNLVLMGQSINALVRLRVTQFMHRVYAFLNRPENQTTIFLYTAAFFAHSVLEPNMPGENAVNVPFIFLALRTRLDIEQLLHMSVSELMGELTVLDGALNGLKESLDDHERMKETMLARLYAVSKDFCDRPEENLMEKIWLFSALFAVSGDISKSKYLDSAKIKQLQKARGAIGRAKLIYEQLLTLNDRITEMRYAIERQEDLKFKIQARLEEAEMHAAAEQVNAQMGALSVQMSEAEKTGQRDTLVGLQSQAQGGSENIRVLGLVEEAMKLMAQGEMAADYWKKFSAGDLYAILNLYLQSPKKDDPFVQKIVAHLRRLMPLSSPVAVDVMGAVQKGAVPAALMGTPAPRLLMAGIEEELQGIGVSVEHTQERIPAGQIREVTLIRVPGVREPLRLEGFDDFTRSSLARLDKRTNTLSVNTAARCSPILIRETLKGEMAHARMESDVEEVICMLEFFIRVDRLRAEAPAEFDEVMTTLGNENELGIDVYNVYRPLSRFLEEGLTAGVIQDVIDYVRAHPDIYPGQSAQLSAMTDGAIFMALGRHYEKRETLAAMKIFAAGLSVAGLNEADARALRRAFDDLSLRHAGEVTEGMTEPAARMMETLLLYRVFSMMGIVVQEGRVQLPPEPRVIQMLSQLGWDETSIRAFLDKARAYRGAVQPLPRLPELGTESPVEAGL